MEDYAIQNTTNINGFALAFLMVVSAIVVSSTRQNAAKTLLVTAAFVPLGQEVVVFGLHFTFLRILILIALCRVFARNEVAGFNLIAIDKLVIFWSLLCMVCGVLRGPKAETFGWVYNELGTYFSFRVLAYSQRRCLSPSTPSIRGDYCCFVHELGIHHPQKSVPCFRRGTRGCGRTERSLQMPGSIQKLYSRGDVCCNSVAIDAWLMVFRNARRGRWRFSRWRVALSALGLRHRVVLCLRCSRR